MTIVIYCFFLLIKEKNNKKETIKTADLRIYHYSHPNPKERNKAKGERWKGKEKNQQPTF